jgi:ATP-dependent RNA helicase HelY
MLERRARSATGCPTRGAAGSDVRLRWPSAPRWSRSSPRRKLAAGDPVRVLPQGLRGRGRAAGAAGVRLTTREQSATRSRRSSTRCSADLPEGPARCSGSRAGGRAARRHRRAPRRHGPGVQGGVEVLFQRGLLKVVVATETLALGINMPARTVVIERLEKWNGESHVLLTPGEYTQLTGRAGRRGIDRVGHAVVLYQRDLDFRPSPGWSGPAPTRCAARSRRRTTWPSTCCAGTTCAGRGAARRLVRPVRGRRVGRASTERLGARGGHRRLRPHLTCELGTGPAYWALRRELSRREKEEAKERRRARRPVRTAIAGLQPGDVLHLPWLGGARAGAVVGVHLTKKGTPIAQVVTDDRALTKVGPRELDGPPSRSSASAARPRQPAPEGLPPQVAVAAACARATPGGRPGRDGPTRTADGDRRRARPRRSALCGRSSAPTPATPARTAPSTSAGSTAPTSSIRRGRRLRQEIGARPARSSASSTASCGARELGYVDETPAPTDEGLRLAGIYSEVDLLVAEALRRGLLDDLDPGARRGRGAVPLRAPGGEVRPRTRSCRPSRCTRPPRTSSSSPRSSAAASARGLRPLRDLDAGFVAPAWRWAAAPTSTTRSATSS